MEKLNLGTYRFSKKAIAATLEWCNRVRESQGLPPILELPKGKRLEGNQCPCGAATQVHVGHRDAGAVCTSYDSNGNRVVRYPLPEWVEVFVELFDHGLLPDYDSEFLKKNGVY